MSTTSNPIESSAAHRASCRPTKIFKGHTDCVRSVAYFPDGRHVASASDDKTVTFWDVESGRQDGPPLQHDSAVLCIAISPDGRRITSGMYEGGMGVVRLWDADTGRPGREPLECDGGVYCVAFSPSRLQIAVGLQDGFFQVFDISTGESVTGPIKGHTDLVWSVAYSLDGRLLITGSADSSIRVWDSQTGIEVGKPLLGHKDVVSCISIAADGRRIATAGLGIWVWDLETRLQIGDSFSTDRAVFSVAFSPDGRYLISGGPRDNRVCLWDAASFAIQSLVSVFRGHTDVVWCVAYFPDGQHVASTSGDKSVIIWDVGSGRQDGPPLQHASAVLWVAISPDGRRIASGLEGGGLAIWDALTRKVVHEIKGVGVWRLAYSPDGRWIATVLMGPGGAVWLWDADTGGPFREPLESDGFVGCVAFSPDGSRITAGLWDGSFQVIDIATGKSVVGPINGHTETVSSVVYSPDGHLLVTGSLDKSIRVWDSKTGMEVGKPMLGHEDDVYCISISADGRRIASAGLDRTVRVWDLETRLQVGDSFDADGWVDSVAFSPDDRYIVSDNTYDVCLWDTESLPIRGPVSILSLLQHSC
ncbi:WD40 repeat-like protein [Leucogyrophana mollusca]|uniref:WD40 repeat-like protein n=1 Tax=Leucogyrophana mollusca TaxID=85980 RepID=A0ACB8B1X3_9AGAM|nr:WD40 repeat-like protein [Leucogyrophana mollusca]